MIYVKRLPSSLSCVRILEKRCISFRVDMFPYAIMYYDSADDHSTSFTVGIAHVASLRNSDPLQ